MKSFKFLGIICLFLFSLYYISEINDILVNQNDLMNEIDNKSNQYLIKPINAVLNGDYIIPGKTGKEVNVFESYHNMKDFNVFNEYYLVYDIIMPEVSIYTNKDKLIEKGNSFNRLITIILDDNSFVEKYLLANNLNYNKLITYDEYQKEVEYEQLNNDSENFNRLNKELDNKICIINDNILELCKKHDYFLVKPKIVLSNENYIEVKNNIEAGQIIMISNNLSLDSFQVFMNEVRFKNYILSYLSELIKE